MYAGRVACCPLMSHGDYADGTDGQTDKGQTVTLCFLLDAVIVIMAMLNELTDSDTLVVMYRLICVTVD